MTWTVLVARATRKHLAKLPAKDQQTSSNSMEWMTAGAKRHCPTHLRHVLVRRNLLQMLGCKGPHASRGVRCQTPLRQNPGARSLCRQAALRGPLLLRAIG